VIPVDSAEIPAPSPQGDVIETETSPVPEGTDGVDPPPPHDGSGKEPTVVEVDDWSFAGFTSPADVTEAPLPIVDPEVALQLTRT
jgi:hypothetical protein